MGREIENNRVTVSGEIISNFELSHSLYGESFYVSDIQSRRSSGTVDIIPIMVSDRLVDVKADWKGRHVKVEGQFRSYNKHTDSGKKLVLSVFVREFKEIEELPFMDCKNYIYIDGYVCKEPVYRATPLGREIGDLLIAVNRPYGKSDYIPCICWGRNARFIENFAVGTHIQIEGRIQSREYQKRITDDVFEVKTAYEISVNKMNVIRETEDSGNEKEN